MPSARRAHGLQRGGADVGGGACASRVVQHDGGPRREKKKKENTAAGRSRVRHAGRGWGHRRSDGRRGGGGGAAAAADARVGRRVSTLFVSRMICVGALPSRRTREQRLGLRVSTTSRSKTGQCAGVSSDASSRRQQARVAVEEPLCGTCHPSRARHSSKEATMQEFHICLALTAVSRSARCLSISAWSTQRGPGFCFGNVLLCQLVKISEYQLA